MLKWDQKLSFIKIWEWSVKIGLIYNWINRSKIDVIDKKFSKIYRRIIQNVETCKKIRKLLFAYR